MCRTRGFRVYVHLRNPREEAWPSRFWFPHVINSLSSLFLNFPLTSAAKLFAGGMDAEEEEEDWTEGEEEEDRRDREGGKSRQKKRRRRTAGGSRSGKKRKRSSCLEAEEDDLGKNAEDEEDLHPSSVALRKRGRKRQKRCATCIVYRTGRILVLGCRSVEEIDYSVTYIWPSLVDL